MVQDLSIVIPVVNSFTDLRTCLQALLSQESASLEIVLVERLGPALRANLDREFDRTAQNIKVISVPSDTTIPIMRAKGVGACTSPAVGVIEDHVVVPTSWARAGLKHLDNGVNVVAGPVVNAATEKLVDWAAFLCEYSAVLPPLPEGPSHGLPGNNIIYKRSVLDQYSDVLAEGKWENYLHDRMKADGVELIMSSDLTAGHKMHYTFGLYMSQRFIYSRAYAGMRVEDQPLSKRLTMGAAACALPAVVFYRTVKNILSKGGHTAHLIRSLPMLGAFSLSWGAGEVVGYLFGGGNALSKVR